MKIKVFRPTNGTSPKTSKSTDRRRLPFLGRKAWWDVFPFPFGIAVPWWLFWKTKAWKIQPPKHQTKGILPRWISKSEWFSNYLPYLKPTVPYYLSAMQFAENLRQNFTESTNLFFKVHVRQIYSRSFCLLNFGRGFSYAIPNYHELAMFPCIPRKEKYHLIVDSFRFFLGVPSFCFQTKHRRYKDLLQMLRRHVSVGGHHGHHLPRDATILNATKKWCQK